MSLKIEDYAMIGDGQSAALVGRDGSIDWLCWPRFDSPSCFARILGDEDNGRWLIAPEDPEAEVTRAYRKNTLILESRWETKDAAAVVIDFMPNTRPDCYLARIVRGLRGTMRFRTELRLRPNYGMAIPWVERVEGKSLKAVVGPDAFVGRVRGAQLHGSDNKHSAEFSVAAGETADFALGYHLSFTDPPPPVEPDKLLHASEQRWRDWTGHFSSGSDYLDLVLHSLITLRALIYEPSGAIVAAPTTSLPEELGGSRNWDYRYCWLRDATFTLFALMNGGYVEEAKAWRTWLLRAVGGDPSQVQIMYGIGGEQRLPEYELPELSGYENSKPVRVGNAAAGQLQIDIYGEVLDALYQARKHGLTEDTNDWPVQIALLEHLETVWHEPDEGIWEVRGGRRHFVYSKVMAWVAFDRAIRTVEDFGLKGPIDKWRRLRAAIHRDICEKGWNPTIRAFTQSYGSDRMDASILLMPLTGFLKADDPRVRSTVEAVEKYLMKDGFIRRYETEGGGDGLAGSEGAFIACSFWFVDCLTLIGRRDEARALFERLTSIATDLGFLAEEYDIANKRMIGNFPQAFSHIALINSAFNLRDVKAPAEERSEQGPDGTRAAGQ